MTISEPSTETVDRILDAAEELFARYGYDGASFRAITGHAGVNLAAVHYHLGDKSALFTLVMTRRLRPINAARLVRLDQAEAAVEGQPVALKLLLDIMVRPFFELAADTAGGGANFTRLLGRCLLEPLPFMSDLFRDELQPAMTRFGQAIRRHTPQLSPQDFLWRLSFVIGSFHHTLATMHRMHEFTRGICRDHDSAGAMGRFIPFAESAFTSSLLGH